MYRDRHRPEAGRPVLRGFTLIELLVVIFIVLLISAVTLPTILPALGNRQVSEAARILQAALAGARDAAIHANAPRGIRLLPDPTLFSAPVNNKNSGALIMPGVLTFSRMVPIEPAPEYSEGKVQIVGDSVPTTSRYLYSQYPNNASVAWPRYPNGLNPATGLPPATGKVLRLEECAYAIIADPANPSSSMPVVNPPTSWWWNIRVGDKVRINDSGAYYTVVGPLTINPNNPGAGGVTNPELYVNDGLPGDIRNLTTGSPIQRTYSGTGVDSAITFTVGVEFLYLVNGVDDDGDGYVDNGWDNVDNDFQNGTDDAVFNLNTLQFGEWETEVWLGSLARYNDSMSLVANLSYSITRRPVVSPGAREQILPGTVVIDATTWNPTSTQERSRLPIDPYNYTVDVLVNQSGQVIATASTVAYSAPTAMRMSDSFLHFWLSDRSDVYDPGAGTGPQGSFVFPTLPWTADAVPVRPNNCGWAINLRTTTLKKDRQLVTLFSRTGQITTNSVENFNPADVNTLYREAQLGIREAK
jgi:prepilin-type N-terminal cleavage/methylation domain-containing protein